MADLLNGVGGTAWGYDASINGGYPYLVSFYPVTPAAAITTVAKTATTQKSVCFTLTTALTGDYKVYLDDTATVEHSTVTASLSGSTLTLTDSGEDIAAGDYYISVTEQGKIESGILRLTVGEYVRKGGGGGTLSYSITFETNGGNKLSSKRITINNVLTEPEVPTKENYIFEGWYTDKELTSKYDFNTKITKAFTLYAKWTEDLSSKIILKIGEKETLVFGSM